MKRVRVLVIDDSAVARKMITESLSSSDGIEVVGTALDPFIAAEKIKSLAPDVLTLDIEMPRMDGITFLSKLMIARPMPVIMVSAFTDKGATATMRAMEAGAVDFILKPGVEGGPAEWTTFGKDLTEKIKVAAEVHVRRKEGKPQPIIRQETKKLVNAQISPFVIAIGASTGGTEVITQILTSLEPGTPGIVITQHMPPKFTAAFAERIDGLSRIAVKEAEHGDRVLVGHAYIAPGGMQMLLRGDAEGYWLEVNNDPPVNRHKPSVDVLFSSVAEAAGVNAMGIILTGMGNDGAYGLKLMKDENCMTIAQNEQSSIVFGMPREAILNGAAQKVQGIEEIIESVKKLS
jgi:two-component system chemotaxis response regulator CheB